VIAVPLMPVLTDEQRAAVAAAIEDAIARREHFTRMDRRGPARRRWRRT
jgi:hypothetical protein